MSQTTSLQKHLEEDLATLSDLLATSGPLQPRVVRSVASAIVRKWLVDGVLNQLAHQLSVKFELPAYDTSEVFVAIYGAPEINFFLAGGITLGGIPIRSIYSSRLPFSGKAPIPLETSIILYDPSKYLKSKRIYFEQQHFSAQQIISFVANKHGGVHFDTNREKSWQEHLEKAAHFMTFGNPKNEEKARVVELSEPGGPSMLIIPNEKGNLWSCLEIELLSAAQPLLNVHCNGIRLITTQDIRH